MGLTKPGDIDHYHAGALLRGICCNAIPSRPPRSACSTWRCAWPGRARRSGTPSSARTTAAPTSSSAATMPARARTATGRTFYDPYAAQELVAAPSRTNSASRWCRSRRWSTCEERAQYLPADEVQAGETVLNISGTELRRRLQEGLEIPDWFSYPEVVAELRRTHPPRHRQGFTVFFTGLSGLGQVHHRQRADGQAAGDWAAAPVTLLDGDIVRKHLSSELGFSREHRDINILRIGFVASEITKNGGIAICAPIAPYAATRREVREMIAPLGGFIEVHVATPLEICEAARPQGALRQGARRHHQGVHRHQRSLRSAGASRAA
ncbi:MAG: adenylyl-sulfate kinase [Chromatiales bacterium]|nr:adenylyl-sulfate kinase [Chromatiales bacterium]